MKGQVTVVTGGAQGIGRAIAEFIATKGGRVAIFDIIDGMEAVKAITDRGGYAEAFIVDIADFNAVEEAINMVVERMGRLDNLVNNAGIAIDRLLLRMKEEDWDKVMAVNLKGAFNCTKAAIRHMLKKGGGIVSISSVAGIMGNAGQSNYAASKAGLIGFTKSIAREYGERNIRANVVAPGLIKTRMTDELDERSKEVIIKSIPLKRYGEPQDVASAVYFLLSEYGAYITGEVINVNGGLYM